MARSDLVEHLLGVSNEEIGQGYTAPQSAGEVDEIIAYELERLRERAVEGILDAAASGDLAAIVWLESHGFLVFPGEYTRAN